MTTNNIDDYFDHRYDNLINFVLDGLDNNSIQMTRHRRDLFDAIYREYVHYC